MLKSTDINVLTADINETLIPIMALHAHGARECYWGAEGFLFEIQIEKWHLASATSLLGRYWICEVLTIEFSKSGSHSSVSREQPAIV